MTKVRVSMPPLASSAATTETDLFPLPSLNDCKSPNPAIIKSLLVLLVGFSLGKYRLQRGQRRDINGWPDEKLLTERGVRRAGRAIGRRQRGAIEQSRSEEHTSELQSPMYL